MVANRVSAQESNSSPSACPFVSSSSPRGDSSAVGNHRSRPPVSVVSASSVAAKREPNVQLGTSAPTLRATRSSARGTATTATVSLETGWSRYPHECTKGATQHSSTTKQETECPQSSGKQLEGHCQRYRKTSCAFPPAHLIQTAELSPAGTCESQWHQVFCQLLSSERLSWTCYQCVVCVCFL